MKKKIQSPLPRTIHLSDSHKDSKRGETTRTLSGKFGEMKRYG